METRSRSPTLIDKMISAIAPGIGLKREVARQKLEIINSGYSHHGANRQKKSMRGWDSMSGSPKEDINNNLDTLRERSRDLYMGGGIVATGAIKTTRTNVVGPGLTLKPSIDAEFLKMSEDEAEAWKKTALREFQYFAESINCDRFRKNNFYELQQLAFLSTLLSGDIFVTMPYKKRKGFLYDLRIQLIESDRVRTPADKYGDHNISQGVEIKDGEINAYYVMKQFPYAENYTGEYKKVLAYGTRTGRRNILHIMESERPEQTRGVPILAPVIEALRQLGNYTQAELTAAVVGGLFTVFVTSEWPSVNIGEGVPLAEQLDPDDEYSYELGAGSIVQLGMGEKIETASPGRPNVAFDGFVSSVLKQVGAALEIPYELLVRHFSSSYSASRAALLEAWKMFRMRRYWFARAFCQPIYEAWLDEAIAIGRLYAPGYFDDPIVRAAYCKAEWHGPSQGQIDPLREVKAAIARIDAEISTREREAAEMTGTDWTVNHRQRVKEETAMQEIRELTNYGGES